MDPITQALHYRIGGESAKPSVTPIYQSSAFAADSTYFYSRKDNPNVAELEAVLAALEGARYATGVSCGMAAIDIVLDLLAPGETLVLNRHLYGCTYQAAFRLAQRRGWQIVVLDLSTQQGIEQIPPSTRIVFFETPTNPFLNTISVKEVARRVKGYNPAALVAVDNTWATPLFQHPLEHGADISLHSGTKYFSGHSDVMSGVLLTNRSDLHEEFRQSRFYSGMLLSPESAWLTRRSLQTLALRVRHQAEVTRCMVDFLRMQPQVARVYYPEVDGDQLRGYGGILFFEFRHDLKDQYIAFRDRLELFGTGTGMACVVSMIAQPYTGSHLSLSPQQKQEMGLTENLVRLCFGLEDVADLQADMTAAFRAIDSGRQE